MARVQEKFIDGNILEAGASGANTGASGLNDLAIAINKATTPIFQQNFLTVTGAANKAMGSYTAAAGDWASGDVAIVNIYAGFSFEGSGASDIRISGNAAALDEISTTNSHIANGGIRFSSYRVIQGDLQTFKDASGLSIFVNDATEFIGGPGIGFASGAFNWIEGAWVMHFRARASNTASGTYRWTVHKEPAP